MLSVALKWEAKKEYLGTKSSPSLMGTRHVPLRTASWALALWVAEIQHLEPEQEGCLFSATSVMLSSHGGICFKFQVYETKHVYIQDSALMLRSAAQWMFVSGEFLPRAFLQSLESSHMWQWNTVTCLGFCFRGKNMIIYCIPKIWGTLVCVVLLNATAFINRVLPESCGNRKKNWRCEV